MLRRAALLLPLAVVETLSLLSCSCPPARAPCAAAPAASSAAVTEPPPPPPSYVLIGRKDGVGKGANFLSHDDGGVFVGGRRIGRRGLTPQLSDDVTSNPLIGAARAPGFAGGEWLFWNSNAIFSSPTFLAPLQPVGGLDGRVSHVSFAPSFALVRLHSGDRFAWDLRARKRVKLSPLGLVDVAALEDGRVAAVFEAGRSAVSIDGGKTWKDTSERVAPHATGLEERDGELWLQSAEGPVYRVAKDGNLEQHVSIPVPQPPPKDPRWTIAEEPLEAALRRGVTVDERTAAVEVQGAIARVDLRSGALLDVTRRVLPSRTTCDMVRMANQLVLACRGGKASVVAVASPFGEPVIEKTFHVEGSFAASEDTLVFHGPCEGPQRPGAGACVRRAGSWSPVGVVEEDAGVDAADSSIAVAVARWIPGPGGALLGFVHHPTPAFFDPVSGTVMQCKRDNNIRYLDGLRSIGRNPVDRSWVLGRDGRLRGWSRDGAIVIDPAKDCALMPSAFDYSTLLTAGERALGIDAAGRFWQSKDFGASWLEVEAPPWSDRTTAPSSCSEVGCVTGAWGRLGWPERPPREPSTPTTVEQPPQLGSSPPPVIACRGTGESKSAVAPAPHPDGTTEPGFGARLFVRRRGDEQTFRVNFGLGVNHPTASTDFASFGLAALMTAKVPNVVDGANGPSPAGPGVLENPYTFQFVEPFDTTLDVKTIVLRLRQLGDGAGLHRQGLLTMTSDGERFGVPVMGQAPGRSDGLLLPMEGPIWVWVRSAGHRQPAVVLALSMEQTDFGDIMGAAAIGEDKLAAVMVSADGEARVVELSPGRSRVIATVPPPPRSTEYPGNVDAIGVDSTGGIALIRMPSGSQIPTEDDPAWLIRGADALKPLAPWFTLQTADTAACLGDSSGHRAILQLRQRWLRLRTGDLRGGDVAPMMAMVRWSAERVCLEAMMTTGPELELRGTTLAPAYIARFAGKPVAARRSFDSGAEYGSSLACTLEPPRP